jgi:hypothetical protein
MPARALVSVRFSRPSLVPPPSSSSSNRSAVRSQVALARTLLDELERATSPRDIQELGEQATAELARLGCRVVEIAATLARVTGEPGI